MRDQRNTSKYRGGQPRLDASKIGGLITTRRVGDDIILGDGENQIIITLENVAPYSKAVKMRIHAPQGVSIGFVRMLPPPPEGPTKPQNS
jgi:hypothetical protein